MTNMTGSKLSMFSHPGKITGYWITTTLTGLTLLQVCACPKPGRGFPTSYVVVFLMFNDLWREMVVRFIDLFLHVVCIQSPLPVNFRL
jgi:hypothetical protein